MLIAAGAFASVPSLLLFSSPKVYGEGGGTDYSPKQDLDKYQNELNQAQQAAAQAQADYEKEKATDPNANMAPMLDAQGKVQGLENMVKYEQQQAAQQPSPATTTEPANETPTNTTTTTEPANENPTNPTTTTVPEPTYQNPQNPAFPADTGPTDGPVHIEPGATVQPSPNPTTTTTEPTNENPTNTTEPASENPQNPTTTTTEPNNENPTNPTTTTTEPNNENPANTTTTTEPNNENPPVKEPTYPNGSDTQPQANPAQPDANDVLRDAPNSNSNPNQAPATKSAMGDLNNGVNYGQKATGENGDATINPTGTTAGSFGTPETDRTKINLKSNGEGAADDSSQVFDKGVAGGGTGPAVFVPSATSSGTVTQSNSSPATTQTAPAATTVSPADQSTKNSSGPANVNPPQFTKPAPAPDVTPPKQDVTPPKTGVTPPKRKKGIDDIFVPPPF
jgi:hypothetical protein